MNKRYIDLKEYLPDLIDDKSLPEVIKSFQDLMEKYKNYEVKFDLAIYEGNFDLRRLETDEEVEVRLVRETTRKKESEINRYKEYLMLKEIYENKEL
jgi:hypothetical protein